MNINKDMKWVLLLGISIGVGLGISIGQIPFISAPFKELPPLFTQYDKKMPTCDIREQSNGPCSPYTQEALETYPAEKCKGIIVGNVECLDDSTLGKGVRACSESITQSEGSVIEEVKRKCPLVENPAEKEPEACAPINGVLYCGTEDEVRTKVYQNQKAYLEKNKKPLEYPLESEGHLNFGFQGAVSRLKTPDGDYICTDGFVLCVKDEKLKELYQLLKSKYE